MPKKSSTRAQRKPVVAAKRPSAKKAVTSPKPIPIERADSGVRRLRAPQRSWYKPRTWHSVKQTKVHTTLPKARHIFVTTLRQLRLNWKLFGGIAAIYGLLNILLVRGLSGSSDLQTIKSGLDSVVNGAGGKLASSATSFIYLLTTSGSGDGASSGVYQAILVTICSLAFIWALRRTTAQQQGRVRDSFYQGMYPLVPFMLVFLIIGLQLVPMIAGSSLYSAVISNGIAVHVWEKGFWLLLFIGLTFWSLRMLSSSALALYIVTLPDMTPIRALQSAKELVRGRRLLVVRKLLFLPLALILLAAVVELPLILFITVLAPWVFFVFSTLSLVVAHGYIYNLYREML